MIIGIASADYMRSDRTPSGLDAWGGSGFARLGQYIPFLEAAGHTVVVGTLWMEGDCLSVEDGYLRKQYPDIILSQRLMMDNLVEAYKVGRAAGQIIVNDVDDWYWGLSPSNEAFKHSHPKHNKYENTIFYKQSLAASSYITVSTPYLYERLSRVLNVPMVTLPNYVDVNRFTPVTITDTDCPEVGWAGSTSHRSGDIEILRGVLGPLVNADHIKLVHAGDWEGSPSFASKLDIAERMVSRKTGRVLAEEYPSILDFEVGLIPLCDTPFNLAKCLDASTRIVTSKGIIRASDVAAGDTILITGQEHQVEAVQHTHSRPGLRLTLDSGAQIKMTLEHRMQDAGGGELMAKDMVVGDCLSLTGGDYTGCNYASVPWPVQSRQSRLASSDNSLYQFGASVPRLIIDERWGTFLGAFAGDGSVSGKTAIAIHCDGIDQDWIDRLTSDLNDMGMTATTEKHTMFDGTLLRRRSVRTANANLLRVLTDLGLTQQAPTAAGVRRRVAVPKIIWESPKPVIAAFLSAYFEADGTVEGSGVSVTSKDESITRDVQSLLLTVFGIASTIKMRMGHAQTGPSRPYWHCYLGRAAADEFASQIGFQSERKRKQLLALTSKAHSNAYRQMNFTPTITNIEPCMVESPVDLQVKGHWFSANGMISHNSDIKGLEYAAAGIPFVASNLPSYVGLANSAFGNGMFLAKNGGQWRKYLDRLRDPDLRRRYQQSLLEAVPGRDISIGAARMVSYLESLVPR